MRIGFVSPDNNHWTFVYLMNEGHNPHHISPACISTAPEPQQFDLIIFNLGDNLGLDLETAERAIVEYIGGASKRPPVLVAFEPDCHPQNVLDFWQRRGMIDFHLAHNQLGLLFKTTPHQQFLS